MASTEYVDLQSMDVGPGDSGVQQIPARDFKDTRNFAFDGHSTISSILSEPIPIYHGTISTQSSVGTIIYETKVSPYVLNTNIPNRVSHIAALFAQWGGSFVLDINFNKTSYIGFKAVIGYVPTDDPSHMATLNHNDIASQNYSVRINPNSETAVSITTPFVSEGMWLSSSHVCGYISMRVYQPLIVALANASTQVSFTIEIRGYNGEITKHFSPLRFRYLTSLRTTQALTSRHLYSNIISPDNISVSNINNAYPPACNDQGKIQSMAFVSPQQLMAGYTNARQSTAGTYPDMMASTNGINSRRYYYQNGSGVFKNASFWRKRKISATGTATSTNSVLTVPKPGDMTVYINISPDASNTATTAAISATVWCNTQVANMDISYLIDGNFDAPPTQVENLSMTVTLNNGNACNIYMGNIIVSGTSQTTWVRVFPIGDGSYSCVQIICNKAQVGGGFVMNVANLNTINTSGVITMSNIKTVSDGVNTLFPKIISELQDANGGDAFPLVVIYSQRTAAELKTAVENFSSGGADVGHIFFSNAADEESRNEGRGFWDTISDGFNWVVNDLMSDSSLIGDIVSGIGNILSWAMPLLIADQVQYSSSVPNLYLDIDNTNKTIRCVHNTEKSNLLAGYTLSKGSISGYREQLNKMRLPNISPIAMQSVGYNNLAASKNPYKASTTYASETSNNRSSTVDTLKRATATSF